MRKLLLASVASMSALIAVSGAAQAQPVKPVAPGTIVVHLNGYLQYALGTMGGNGMVGAGYKNNAIGSIGDIRLYPGFDGMTVDGIGYGAQIELRTTTSNANGSGVNSNATSGNGFDGLYIRRAYGYIGTDDYGYIRFGQTDGAFGLLQRGVIEAFGDGNQWTADGAPVNMLPSGAPGQFIYADQGGLYTTSKIVYISPSVDEPLLGGKLSAIISFEPNSNGIKEGYATFSGPLGASNSAIDGGSNARRRNTFDGMVGYDIKVAGIATKTSVGYLASSPLGNMTGAQEYASMGVFQAGTQATYKALFTDFDNITVGANLKTGSVLDGYKFKTKGERNALSYIVGASYVNGPYEVGGSFFDTQSAASVGAHGHTLSEYGLAAGANYAVAKPMSLWLEYMYGNKHTATSNGHAQVLALGATLKW